MQALRGPLDNHRRWWVHAAFDSFEKYFDGTVDVEEVIKRFDSSMHPDVLTEGKKKLQVFRNFLRTFDVGEYNEEGHVTRSDFENYYRNVSASIENSDDFEHLIRAVWHLDHEGLCKDEYCNSE